MVTLEEKGGDQEDQWRINVEKVKAKCHSKQCDSG